MGESKVVEGNVYNLEHLFLPLPHTQADSATGSAAAVLSMSQVCYDNNK